MAESRSATCMKIESDDGGAVHVTCCLDDDMALCGLDVTDAPWGAGDDELMCVVCAHLMGVDWCPHELDCVGR